MKQVDWKIIQLLALIVFITVNAQNTPSIVEQVKETKSSLITPIYAGSLELDDKILRLNTCIFKNITLPFAKSFYESTEMDVIASISETQMDQNFAYQIKYQILCPSNCIIDFTLSRFTQKVSQNFKYHLVIDFLIANKLRSTVLNMTTNKVDFNIEQLFSNDQVYNIQDYEILLIPNGFNHIGMTGFVKYFPMASSNRIIIQFQDQDNLKQLWALNKHFILYRILLVPKQLNSLDRSQCKIYSSFKGFLSTKESQISLNLHSQKPRLSFAQFQLPLECNTQFADERKPMQKSTFVSQSIISPKYVIIIALFLLAQVAYLFYRNRQASLNKNNPLKLPQMLISFEASQIVTIQENKVTQPKMETELNSEKIVELE